MGTGNMARGIASRLLVGDNDFTLPGTEAGKAQELADARAGAARHSRYDAPAAAGAKLPERLEAHKPGGGSRGRDREAYTMSIVITGVPA